MEWNEVKTKPKRKAKPQQDQEVIGGMTNKGTLKAGPVNQGFQVTSNATKSASAIANYDPLEREGSDEEIKFEKVSHDCAVAIANARL